MDASLGKRHRNWWKLAFLLALLAFEFEREQLVVEQNQPFGGASLTIGRFGHLVSAQGQWIRTDGGPQLVGNSVTIECGIDLQTCTEATVNMIPGAHNAEIFVDHYATDQFSDSLVAYTDDSSVCAITRTTIDLTQKRVTSTREIKPEATAEACEHIEPRMVSELSDGIKRIGDDSWEKEHFLPIRSLLRGL